MGRFYIAETLLSITAQPAPKVPETPLAPIVPGAWAAWARAAVAEPTATPPVRTAPARNPKPVRESGAG